MKIKKTAVSLLAALLVMFSLSGCIGNFYPVALRVDGYEVSPGMYLMQQYNAYREAGELAENPDKDQRKQKIEGINGNKWIKNEAVRLCREYVCVQNLAKEYGLELSDESLDSMSQNEYMWSWLEQVYIENGISKETWTENLKGSLLKTDVFDYLYTGEGEKAWSREELVAKVEASYAPIRFLYVSFKDADGNVIEDIEKFKGALEKLVDKLNSGELSLDEAREQEIPGLYELLGIEFTETSSTISLSHIDYETEQDDFYTAEWLDKMKSMELGEFASYYTQNNTVLLYEKVKAFNNDDEEYEKMQASFTRQIRGAEYDEYLAGIYDGYSVKIPFGMQLFYRPSKIYVSDNN